MATAAPQEAHSELDRMHAVLVAGNPRPHGYYGVQVEYRDGEFVFIRPIYEGSQPQKKRS